MVDTVTTSSPSLDDIPFEEIDSGEDVPLEIEEVNTVSSGAVRNRELSHSAIIQNHLDGSDIVESFAQFEGETDSNNLLSLKAQEKATTDSSDLEEAFIDNPGTTPTEMGDNAKIVKELMLDAQASGTNVPQHVIEAASSLDADPAIQAKLQGQLKMLLDVQKLAEDLTGFDIARDIVTSLLPGSIIKDNLDATGSAFGAEKVMRDMVVGFKSLSAAEQEEQWPALKEHLIDALPESRAVSALARFLDPVGEEKLSDFSGWWAALDTVDVATTGFAIAKTVASVTKQLNGIKMLTKLKSEEEAAKVNAIAVIDDSGDVAEKSGIDKVTAYNNAMPFEVSKLDEAYAEGLSTKTLDNINNIKEGQAKVVSELASDEKTLREGLLTPNERAKAEDRIVKEFTDSGFEKITPVSRTPDSTVFSYSLVDETGEVLSDTEKFDLKLSDVGVWENTENSLLPKWFTSPSAWSKGDTKEGALQAVRLDSLSAKVGEQLRKLQRDATAPLLGERGLGGLFPNKRSQMAAVDDVLLTGDNLNKVFTPEELKAGVNGNPFSDAQVETYYNVRSLYDNLYLLRNVGEKRKLTAQGMKEVNMLKHKEIGKPFDDELSARGGLTSSGANKVFDDVSSSVVNVDKLDLKKIYAEGKQLTSLKSPISLGEKGGEFNMVIVKRNGVKELPENILHFKNGYVPRVNKNAYWFLKEAKTGQINGVTPKEPLLGKTHRYFDNKKEADEVLAEFQAKNPDRQYVVKEDREVEQQIVGGSNLGSGGGLYTGSRSTDPIGFGRDSLPAERFGAFEALSQNIQGMQQFMSRNQWRMGMEQRWVNTAENLGVPVTKFDPRQATEGTESGAFLRDMGQQIQDWNGFPSKGEMVWDEKVRAASEWALNRGFSRDTKLVQGLHYLDHKDPIAAARSASFHTLLGFFNPAQLWVQAQGASISMTMATKAGDPLGAFKALKNQFALGFANTSDRPAYRAHIAKSSGLDVKDLDEMVELWRKTGYEDSILTTADHAASISNHGIGAEALRQAADAGLLFYRQGELFNRRTAFQVALQEFKSANKGKKVGDEELKAIMTRANNFMLNLSKANRAGFQKGIASIPTQFLQVQAKMWEGILGINDLYTRGERAKIMFGQVALYGAAGVPLGDLAVRWYSETTGLNQAETEALDPELVKGINQGFWGWFALSAFGADIDIANRGAIASGVEQLSEDLIFGDSSLGETMFGAFGQVPLRFFKAYNEIKPYAIAHLETGTVPDIATVTKAGSALAKVTSTWNNAQKGIFMQEFNMIQDSRNKPVTKPGEVGLSTGTIVSQMFGFSPSISGRIRDMDSLNKDIEEHRSNVANTIVQTMWDYSKEVDTADSEEERQRIVDKYASVQQVMLGSLRTPRDKRLVREQVQRILTSKSKRSKTVKKFLENFNDGRVADIHTLHASFISRGLLQALGPQEGEK